MLDKSFIQDLLSRVSYQRMLMVGNFKKEEAVALSEDIAGILGLKSNKLKSPICSKVSKLNPG